MRAALILLLVCMGPWSLMGCQIVPWADQQQIEMLKALILQQQGQIFSEEQQLAATRSRCR